MPGYRITVTVYDPGKQPAVSAWPLEAGSCSRDVAGRNPSRTGRLDARGNGAERRPRAGEAGVRGRSRKRRWRTSPFAENAKYYNGGFLRRHPARRQVSEQ